MRCHSSKFLLISIVTFAIAVGFVQIWQGLNRPKQLFETENQLISSAETENIKVNHNNPCEDLKKFPIEEIKKSPSDNNWGDMTVSLGIVNQRVCQSLPFYETDKLKEGKDYVFVQVSIDKNGFIQQASANGNGKFARRVEKFSKTLRMPPIIISGKRIRGVGVLIFYSKERYSEK